jgi:hypothetical protein
MNGNGRRAPDLASLRARRERLAGAAYKATLRGMTDAEFAGEVRAEVRVHLGAAVDSMTDEEAAAAAEDLWIADLEERAEHLDVGEYAQLILLRQYRAGREARAVGTE